MTETDAKKSVIQAGIRLVGSGLIARTWGNVSCRINENRFAITPSGRDYLTLTPDDIVEVNISDLSYNGNIKPSSEKGVHAEVYRLHPGINFVIHTHQDNASAMSTFGLDVIQLPGASQLLGGEVVCTGYGLPGTKKLRRKVAEALLISKGQAVIMKNHGALCFGKDADEAFQAAKELEDSYEGFISNRYLKISGQKSFDWDSMRLSALSRLLGENTGSCSSTGNNEDPAVNKSINELSEKIINDHKNHKDINYIIHNSTPDIKAVSNSGIKKLKPLLDDFAQIAGISVDIVDNDVVKISAALKKSSAVMIKDMGALCCGSSKWDAEAVGMIVDKNCRALIGASLFKGAKPINPIECRLMRHIYLSRYSKQAK